MNVRCQIAVVVLDEDGNEVATMWPFNADASHQWVPKVELTQEECDNMVRLGIEELQKLKARWASAAYPSPSEPCSEPAPDADAPRE